MELRRRRLPRQTRPKPTVEGSMQRTHAVRCQNHEERDT